MNQPYGSTSNHLPNMVWNLRRSALCFATFGAPLSALRGRLTVHRARRLKACLALPAAAADLQERGSPGGRRLSADAAGGGKVPPLAQEHEQPGLQGLLGPGGATLGFARPLKRKPKAMRRSTCPLWRLPGTRPACPRFQQPISRLESRSRISSTSRPQDPIECLHHVNQSMSPGSCRSSAWRACEGRD